MSRLCTVFFAAALASGCGDDAYTAPLAPEVPTKVAVSPAEVRLDAHGSTAQLTVQLLDRNGKPMTAPVRWSSSSTAVAAVDSTGLASAVGDGTATVTAAVGGITGTATVTVSVAATDSTATDRAALVALYEATDGPNWVNDENWLTDASLGEWFGVRTTDEGRVVALEMAYYDSDADQWISNNLSGPIPPELGDLTRLEHLQFFENNLTGAIPPELGNLANLSTLDFSSNDVSGPIPPEIASLARLTSLNLGGNGLSGSIPPELGGLANLSLLWLWNNNLTGPIPAELGGLVNLTSLSLWRNSLTGPIPVELGGLANLDDLNLERNELTGPIPAELGTLGNLTTLSLGRNNLTGPIPVELGGLANLTYLNLGDNELSGPIPAELGGLANLNDLNLRRNELSGPIPAELGGLTNLTWLSLWRNTLTGPIPVELGGLVNLAYLDLGRNELSGPVPAELGGLTNLTRFSLFRNDLTGPIPQSFLQLDGLVAFYIGGNESLCVPGTSAFLAWLQGIERRDRDQSEALCNGADVEALKSLYETAGGTGWTESAGWSGEGALEDWHGVSTDSVGRVVVLDLSRNALVGRLPRNLAELGRMTELRIAGNPGLSGRLPLTLTEIDLQTLHYSGTGLCAPTDASFRDWLGAIPSHEGTGTGCPPLSDREILEALYEATGGPEWVHNENWLTDAPLGEWYGVEVDDEHRVVGLGAFANGLRGRIPPELGALASLEWLWLDRNDLTGPIPPELGGLANLRELGLAENSLSDAVPSELGNLDNLHGLGLAENDLSGSLPPELGNLDNLRWLSVNANRLTGSIPRDLGGLTNLEELNLGRNHLTGAIPPELGKLANLSRLNLATNRLTGSIPIEFGGLANLEELYLGANELSGPLPPEFGSLTDLRRLAVQTNAGLTGALPFSLMGLGSLETLAAGGTGLCVPGDPDFVDWLQRVPNRRVAPCSGELPMAYLVQAVQSRVAPVSLVAGERALLRVFPTAVRTNAERIPRVRASFHVGEELMHVADIPANVGPIPTEVDEGSLANSANAVIPAAVIRPGLEMVIEIDPDSVLDSELGVPVRIPQTGRMAVDVRDMPLLDLTLVPFLWTEDPDSVVLEAVDGMTADPSGHEMLGLTRNLLPVGELKVTAHLPVLSSSNNAYDLISQTSAIRVMEGTTGHWMGMMSGAVTGAGGLGGGLDSFAVPDAGVIAHEFGHNFSLPHAPCGGAGGPDPAYPTSDGTIGVWGYDFDTGLLVPPTREDIMGYCGGEEISDYFFTKALFHRLATEGTEATAAAARPSRSLLLWGGANSDGELHLNPAFVVDAAPALPRSGGEYRLVGRATNGRELFALSFDMPEIADGDGSSSFALGLPVDPSWAADLASIAFSGPGGSAFLDADTGRPMAILLDPDNGRVRAILRDVPFASQVAADAAGRADGSQLEVLFSRGIPDDAAWRR